MMKIVIIAFGMDKHVTENSLNTLLIDWLHACSHTAQNISLEK